MFEDCLTPYPISEDILHYKPTALQEHAVVAMFGTFAMFACIRINKTFLELLQPEFYTMRKTETGKDEVAANLMTNEIHIIGAAMSVVLLLRDASANGFLSVVFAP